ncbi:MAG: SpoIIE family protein phosphatase [Anaerolineae bacterium]|nr:SpoIIE family protein phosphatase [Anaerolineae bacterium]
MRTFTTEERFIAILVGGAQGRGQAVHVADEVVAGLRQGASPDVAAETALVALPRDVHVSLSVLQVEKAQEAHIVECDAPPLFLVQDGQPVLLPVVEDTVGDYLIRQCRFSLQEGDHLAMTSEGFLQPRGRRWGWPDIAVAVRRWTDTGCDADELLGALVRTYQRLNPDPPQQDVTVVAMHVRPMRTATIWTGPPVDAAQDEAVLRLLMAEQGERVICGGATAQIAARLLKAELKTDPRPADGADGSHPWEEVPPTFRLEGVNLVTEGLITLRKAREQMAGVGEQVRGARLEIGDWRLDGATRLAWALLAADRVHFVVGLAANSQQVDESGAPLRKGVVEDLMRELEARGKLVSVEYV